MEAQTHGILDPDVHEAVKSLTLDIGDRRVREDRGTRSLDLGLGGLFLSDSLGRGQSQEAQGEKSLLGEHLCKVLQGRGEIECLSKRRKEEDDPAMHAIL